MYGVAGRDGGFIEVSRTLQGAKNYATRHGYDEVFYCSPHSWAVILEAQKQGKKKWHDVQYCTVDGITYSTKSN